MEKQLEIYTKYRLEFFRELLPPFFYTGSDKKKINLINTLKTEGADFIYELFQTLYTTDNTACPYPKDDFHTFHDDRGKIEMIRIELPAYQTAKDDILRAYIVFSHKPDNQLYTKYFLIWKDQNKKIFSKYLDSKNSWQTGSDLTGYDRHIAYEQQIIINDFSTLFANDLNQKNVI